MLWICDDGSWGYDLNCDFFDADGGDCGDAGGDDDSTDGDGDGDGADDS